MLNSSIDGTMNSGNPERILGQELFGDPLGGDTPAGALIPLAEANVNGWGEALGLGVGVGVYSYISGYTLNDSRALGGDAVASNVKADDLTNATSLFLFNNTLKDSLIIENMSDATMDATMNLTRLQHENDVMFTKMVNMIVLTVVLGLIILITIIGNVFVIAAIILERNLQNVANYLVASLAVADLLVACLVMPLGAVYEISQGWILGPELCDIWTSCDVLCCTASILHLVAIAADRYWTVTNIDYNNLRTPRRVFFMIFCVWSAAVVVSLAPQFGWKDPEYMKRIEEQKCMVSQDVAYQIFATCCTFYVPLLIILGLYWKIYQIARKRIQRHTKRQFPTGSKPIAGQTPEGAAAAAAAGAASAGGPSEKVATATSGDSNQRRRLKACFDKALYSAAAGAGAATAAAGSEPRAGSTLDVYPRNSFSMAHTREETDFSTSNFDSKSHAGTEVTTVSSDADELRAPAAIDISTVSLQVASTVHSQQAASMALATTSASHISAQQQQQQKEHEQQQQQQQQKAQQKGTQQGTRHMASVPNPHQKLAKRRQMLEAKRERKAAQTLAIITGAFAVCWLPFFVMVLLLTLCKECHIHAAIASLVLWLGYFNSTLNPIIYTIFNPEFRRAFQRMLFGRKRYPLHQRSGKI